MSRTPTLIRLVVAMIVVFTLVGLIMYFAGVFDSRKEFEGTWRGNATTNMRCSDGSQDQATSPSEIRIAINHNRSDSIAVTNNFCTLPMRVNGNMASMIPGSQCESYDRDTGNTASIIDASFIRSGNSIEASFTTSAVNNALTCSFVTSGQLTRQP